MSMASVHLPSEVDGGPGGGAGPGQQGSFRIYSEHGEGTSYIFSTVPHGAGYPEDLPPPELSPGVSFVTLTQDAVGNYGTEGRAGPSFTIATNDGTMNGMVPDAWPTGPGVTERIDYLADGWLMSVSGPPGSLVPEAPASMSDMVNSIGVTAFMNTGLSLPAGPHTISLVGLDADGTALWRVDMPLLVNRTEVALSYDVLDFGGGNTIPGVLTLYEPGPSEPDNLVNWMWVDFWYMGITHVTFTTDAPGLVPDVPASSPAYINDGGEGTGWGRPAMAKFQGPTPPAGTYTATMKGFAGPKEIFSYSDTLDFAPELPPGEEPINWNLIVGVAHDSGYPPYGQDSSHWSRSDLIDVYLTDTLPTGPPVSRVAKISDSPPPTEIVKISASCEDASGVSIPVVQITGSSEQIFATLNIRPFQDALDPNTRHRIDISFMGRNAGDDTMTWLTSATYYMDTV